MGSGSRAARGGEAAGGGARASASAAAAAAAARKSGSGRGIIARLGGAHRAAAAALVAVAAALALASLAPERAAHTARTHTDAVLGEDTQAGASDNGALFLRQTGGPILADMEDKGSLQPMLASLKAGEPYESGFMPHAVPSILKVVREQLGEKRVDTLVPEEMFAVVMASVEAHIAAAGKEERAGEAERWHGMLDEAGLAADAAAAGFGGLSPALDAWLDEVCVRARDRARESAYVRRRRPAWLTRARASTTRRLRPSSSAPRRSPSGAWRSRCPTPPRNSSTTRCCPISGQTGRRVWNSASSAGPKQARQRSTRRRATDRGTSAKSSDS